MLYRLLAFVVLLALVVLVQTPAKAEWFEASGERFVIYADDDESSIRTFASNLERFHNLLEVVTGLQPAPPPPSNRLKVYVAGSAGDVASLAGDSGVQGFYIPRVGNSVAFTPTIKMDAQTVSPTTAILRHEYTHHFFASASPYGMPLWMSEGSAEFFGGTGFDEDGNGFSGIYVRDNFVELYEAASNGIQIGRLLAQDPSSFSGRLNRSAFYAQSWRLYWVLSLNEERDGQLRDYWSEVAKGTPSVEAGGKAFGSLAALSREMGKSFRSWDWQQSLMTPANETQPGKVTLRKMSAGEVEMMAMTMRLQRGVQQAEAVELASKARKVAAKHPDDARVILTLAQAELAADMNGSAIAAADRATALNPDLGDAYVYKGLAQFREARATPNSAAKQLAYKNALTTFEILQSVEPDHPIALQSVFRFYAEQNLDPPLKARKALAKAAALAPFDRELALINGMNHLHFGEIADARQAVQPLASDPHAGEKSEQARSLLGFLSTKKEGEAVPVLEAIADYFASE